MKPFTRRHFLRSTATGTAALAGLPPLIRDALAIQPKTVSGTLQDVAHIVVLMQENRSFDHYFGSLGGVRGFGDRFPIPLAAPAGAPPRTVWQQSRTDADKASGVLLPFHLDTQRNFALMRAEGTPHSWLDAQQAWDQGRMGQWTQAKGPHSLGYYTRADLPFQYALADAFTVCDAYHCSFFGGTNTNRLFLWTGSNDPHGLGGGPATYNDLDSLKSKSELGSYSWTTYPERLQAAGISWQIYQDMADNYDDNPLVGFKVFRDAHAALPGASAELRARAMSTRDLTQLRADVQANQLPQVSWIIADAKASEHPEQSSPAQGADYTARVLAALTSNPEVWSRTVLILNFDENDGYFDHLPPPAPPSYVSWHADPARAHLAGASSVETSGEYHERLVSYHNDERERTRLHQPYGLGQRVPMLVISPWSRGGWVNSQVFDHTSVIRFMEQRFGVMEPNISAWRRAVCGDLTSTLDFARPNHAPLPTLPATAALAQRARAMTERTLPVAPTHSSMPAQGATTRPSRALPYQLQVKAECRPDAAELALVFINSGSAGAVFHVYDHLKLDQIPRRYTVASGQQLTGVWSGSGQAEAYDLWLLGPNGFHRHFSGSLRRNAGAAPALPELEVEYSPAGTDLHLRLCNRGARACTFELQANAYADSRVRRYRVSANGEAQVNWPLGKSAGWYDLSLRVAQHPGFVRRLAGRVETGAPSISDPAMRSSPAKERPPAVVNRTTG